ncbi:MAG TPA: sulfite exporter TauE/SafE family protein [Xanthobacteraceae bacterium]|nr:sulfite exporter TauE/SafE family protein [Xanthobacteraceae bacterium]
MHLIEAIDPLYSVCGFVVGALVGMTGVGGGALMTPLLILLFGIQASTAVGTDLLYACVTKTGGTAVHGLLHTVDWRVVRRLAAGSVPATALTLLVLSRFDMQSYGTNHLITTLLGLALLATCAALVFRRQILARYAQRVGALGAGRVSTLTIAVGAALGVMVTISSVGAGALGVTALLLLYPHLPIARVVGSDIAHAVPLTLIAGVGHWALGSIDWPLFGSLLVGSLPGIALGSLVAIRVPDLALRLTLAAVLAVVAGRLLF